jgi:hypothetical protein
MSTREKISICFAGLALLFAVTNTALGQTSQETKAASVLSNQVESVFFAKTNVLLNVGTYKGMNAHSIRTLNLPFAELLQGLKFAGLANSGSLVSDSDAVMVGARNFLEVRR